MRKVNLILIFIVILSSYSFGQITGLSGWNIFVDQGHSRTQNMGLFNYSEAEKVLRVGLNLRELLLSKTDIDTVYVTRENDDVNISLSQRTTRANNLGAAWYHSIHSNAGSSTANSTLLLWGQYYNGNEKNPPGGQAMSAIMVDILTRGYRTYTDGSWGDCTFYSYTGACSPSWPGPYLHVNRETTMPSELSEGGFHTNARQNQLNMNAEWKRLEAYTFFWSILKFHNIPRPYVGIATGIISDKESGIPINGATITINNQSYSTDTYASLFYKYSPDPDQLHNGFYFLEDIPAGTYDVYVEAPDYLSDTLQITMSDTFFTFLDVKLVSTLPPYVTATEPADGDTNFVAYDPITIEFSRPMDTTSVRSAIEFDPAVTGDYSWYSNDTKLKIFPDSLAFETDYTLIIHAEAQDKYGHFIDGNTTRTSGDDHIIYFRTGREDIFEPEISEVYPFNGQNGIELQPIISITYDELLDPVSVQDSLFDLDDIPVGPPSVSGILKHYTRKNKSVLNFFPAQTLQPNKLYRSKILPGLRDLLGNEVSSVEIYAFTTGQYDYDITSIDNFNGSGVTSNWWEPQQSGSTTGINTDSTGRSADTNYVNILTGSNQSMKLRYGWDMNASNWLIRTYLGGGPARTVLFDSTKSLQVYIFGDGSGTKFRFAVDDKYPNLAASNHEVSPWFTIDWIGWKLVSWDLANDGTGTWLGDGSLDGALRFDSFQLAYESGADLSGVIYFDDLRVVDKIVLDIEPDITNQHIPSEYVLYQNFPNPFNPETEIKYALPGNTSVKISVYTMLGEKIATLVDGYQYAGIHKVRFNAENLASGLYLYRIETSEFQQVKRMLLVK